MKSDDIEQIETLISDRTAAVASGNAERISATIAEDAVIFDVVPPLRAVGREAARRRFREWLETYCGAPRWETLELRVACDGAVAFAHMISRVTGTLVSGSPVDMWFRTTLGFEKRDGRWLIVHDHSADPFDPETGKAITETRP